MFAIVPASARRLIALLMPVFLLAGIVACADEVTSQEPPARRSSGGAQSSASPDGPLATVDGEVITRADLEEFVGNELATLEHQYGSQLYELLEAGVTQAVRQRLLAAEASTRGVAVEEMVLTEDVMAIADGRYDVHTNFNYSFSGAGYRNRMVHFYSEVTDRELYELCRAGTDDIEQVLDALLAWLRANPDRIDRSL